MNLLCSGPWASGVCLVVYVYGTPNMEVVEDSMRPGDLRTCDHMLFSLRKQTREENHQ